MILLRPLRYLTIRHRAKVSIDIVTPIAIAVALTALIRWSSPSGVFGKDGYVASFQAILTVLGGFFVAALTMVTTATLPVLKESVGGREPPRLPNETAPLSRKRFLAYMFGYLATSAFCLVAISVVANIVAPGIKAHLATPTHEILKWSFVGAFTLWVSHVFVTTLLGLFYFTERLQMSDARSRVGNPDGEARVLPDSSEGVRVYVGGDRPTIRQ